MRQYLYVFLGLVLAGMIILTAACPECRQVATMQQPEKGSYYVYDSNGDRLFAVGTPCASSSMYANRTAAEQKF